MYCLNSNRYIVYIILLLCLMMQTACVSQHQKTNSKSTQSNKMEPVTLFSFKTNYTVKKGQQLEFSYEGNASVGTTADYQLEDENLIKYVTTEVSTPNAEEGAGGYNENITFIFEALQIGKSKIVVQEYNQLEPSKRYEFVITIE